MTGSRWRPGRSAASQASHRRAGPGRAGTSWHRGHPVQRADPALAQGRGIPVRRLTLPLPRTGRQSDEGLIPLHGAMQHAAPWLSLPSGRQVPG